MADELIERAGEFYRRHSSSYSPKMDGGDRYELMADFATVETAELRARAELAERRLAIAMKGVEHYASEKTWACDIPHICNREDRGEICKMTVYTGMRGYTLAQQIKESVTLAGGAKHWNCKQGLFE